MRGVNGSFFTDTCPTQGLSRPSSRNFNLTRPRRIRGSFHCFFFMVLLFFLGWRFVFFPVFARKETGSCVQINITREAVITLQVEVH